MTTVKEVLVAAPNGFCAGVVRAIEIVERALNKYGAPIYVRHEIVHNEYVVQQLKEKGAIFVNELDEVPANSRVIFSAHGVSQSVVQEAQQRKLQVLDATCPLVTRVHHQVKKLHDQTREIIMIGHAGHPEVEGTMGQIKTGIYLVQDVADAQSIVVNNPDNVAYVTQTTLSVDDTEEIVAELRARFPALTGMGKTDICYATTNRQEAVKTIAQQVDLMLIIGSQRSSNSLRLLESARLKSPAAFLIGGVQDLQSEWFAKSPRVGVSAGASTPNVLVQEVLIALKKLGASSVKTIQVKHEKAEFALPAELRMSKNQSSIKS